eukprot:GHRR01034541.1.p1 GENE.GHRR01034541.1~~GHRR01034541.1.p1  ORF type:complete len:282 (+),score=46.23 GHRR01034541.1:733-1578(+)
MLQPRSRNWLAYLQQSYNDPHGLNAGGTATMSHNHKLKWPAGQYNYCGDSYKERRWDLPGPIQSTYVLGQVINIDSVFAVNHLGRIDVQLCNLKAKPGDKKCRQLQRADGKGIYWYLPFVENWTGGNSGHSRPMYGDGSFSYYLMPEVLAPEGCQKQAACNMFKDMVVYRTQWRLPKGFTCNHCKLQWHYMTAHNCWPPCPAANKGDPSCPNVQLYPTCGMPGTDYPEQFWNCADVKIGQPTSKSSASQKTENLPVWANKALLHTGTFGTGKAYKSVTAGK